MPRIKVTLTLELELQQAGDAAKYVDSATGEATLDYLADLWDDSQLEFAATYPETALISINGITAEQVKIALATRVP